MLLARGNKMKKSRLRKRRKKRGKTNSKPSTLLMISSYSMRILVQKDYGAEIFTARSPRLDHCPNWADNFTILLETFLAAGSISMGQQWREKIVPKVIKEALNLMNSQERFLILAQSNSKNKNHTTIIPLAEN